MILASFLRLDQPWWLLAAPAAAVPILIGVMVHRRGRRVAAWAVAMQCAAVLLAVAAMAQPAARTGRKSQLPWLILRDVSASTRGQDSNLTNWPASLPRQTVDFAGDVFQSGESVSAAEGTAAVAGRRGLDSTLIRPPLQLALGRSEELAGVVVVSDGQWQDERWQDAAETIRRAGLPLLVVPLDAPPPDARVADFHAVRTADGKVALHVALAADSPLARTLTISRDGLTTPLLVKDVELLPGEGFTARIEDESAGAGSTGGSSALVYRAEIAPHDAIPENDSAVAVMPPLSMRLALVTEKPAFFSGVSLPSGFPQGQPNGEVTEVIRPADAPRTAAGWTPLSCVLLDNPTGTLLDASQRASLEEYVRAGGGLVTVGSGPWASLRDRQDPLNRAAALVPNPYERRPLRVVVVLDSSGSMGESAASPRRSGQPPPASGRRKFDLAVLATTSLRGQLTRHDSLAVITFSDSPRLVYDSGSGAPDFAAIREAMSSVQPGGPTDIAPAIEEATASPAPIAPGESSAEPRGLVIVVSDLITRPFDVQEMARRFRDQGYGLAVVDIEPAGEAGETGRTGPAESSGSQVQSRASMESLARLLGAPVVPQEDLSGLADVFGRFIRQARGGPVRRGDFRLSAAGAVFGQSISALPAADAYALCAPQEGEARAGSPKAEVLATVGDDPVIARRVVGLGRSVSIALPVDANTNVALARSAAMTDMLNAAVQWSARVSCDSRFSCRVDQAGGHVRLSALARDNGVPMNMLKLTARVAPAGPIDQAVAPSKVQEIPLVQVGPGQYGGTIGEAMGPVIIEVVGADGAAVWRGAYGPSYGQELAAIGPNWANLQRLAALAGGRIVPMSSLRAAGGEIVRSEYSPLAAVLLAVAAALMLIEWIMVRIVRR